MDLAVFEDLRLRGYGPRTLLDIGAHIGTFTQGFLRVFPGCAPTLVEPNPFCQDDLAKLPFERHAVAASAEPGRAELFLTREWLQSTGTSLYRENTDFFRDEVVIKQEVDKVRIDDLFRGRRFDFVKIDTQGSELDVLQGGREVLSQADYILIEISLVEYNIGGAAPEAIFSLLASMGFRCADVTDFHRLGGVQNGGLLQMDFLFERQSLRSPQTHVDKLTDLANRLRLEGRLDHAITLYEHLDILRPRHEATLCGLIAALGAQGRTLGVLERLADLRACGMPAGALASLVQQHAPPAIVRFNALKDAGQIEEAERHAAALASLFPANPAMLAAAIACNRVLGRPVEAARYARALLAVEPGSPAALAAIAEASPAPQQAPAAEAHPLIRLRDLHDTASAILCRPLTLEGEAEVERLLAEAGALEINAAPGSEWELWEKHYRLLLAGVDLAAVAAPTPAALVEPELEYMASTGERLDADGLHAHAERLGARAVFFAAADESYVELYARWYALSILKHCDVPFLIVVHVIGGKGRLAESAGKVGVQDERLVYAGDGFDASAVTIRCYDAPPKGLASRPLAHFQCQRFLRLGGLLEGLQTPVFVSDIDLLLQRGVADLLERCAGADVTLNENDGNLNAGSRLTANLLLVQPTLDAGVFLRFLRSYLEAALAGAEVTRWIDQLGLLMAWQHLMKRGAAPSIAYFDTQTDINNVIYPSYQENPFRFLSLYHGFDTSSLEDHPSLAAPSTAPPDQGRARKARAAKAR
jgi:FkbM family methyltransferase